LPEASPSKFSHVDLVVSDIDRSLTFYRGLLEPLGWTGLNEVAGERGETIHYISQEGPGVAALGVVRLHPGLLRGLLLRPGRDQAGDPPSAGILELRDWLTASP
jgi:catechol 2,3-dioxygenase-like lactoylglutathione lyase family enzyme